MFLPWVGPQVALSTGQHAHEREHVGLCPDRDHVYLGKIRLRFSGLVFPFEMLGGFMVSSSLARHPKPGLDRDQPTLADTS